MDLARATLLSKALADPTRLRLLGLLAAGEATVGELVQVLGQNQPRVSRHLRLLAAAGLLTHFRDGRWMYYRLEQGGMAAGLAGRLMAAIRTGDPMVCADEARMAVVRQRREGYALGARMGSPGPVVASLDRPPEDALAQALDDALGRGPLGDVLDVGVGSGVLLRLLTPRARSAVGLDSSRAMRVLARSRLQAAGLAHCTVRSGDLHALPFPGLSFDLVVLDEVLALSAAPEVALDEALRVLRPAGRLLLIDRILPPARQLVRTPEERGLYENQLLALLGARGLRSGRPVWLPGRRPGHALLVAGLPLAVSRKEIA